MSAGKFRSAIVLATSALLWFVPGGAMLAQIPTSITLAISNPTPTNHTAVTLTASVTIPSVPGPATGGTVTFFDNGVYQLGTAIVQGGLGTPGNAVVNVSFPAGQHFLTAAYSGITGNSTVSSLAPASSSSMAITVGGTEQADLDCFFELSTAFSTLYNTTNPNQVACGVWGYALQPLAGTVNLTDETTNTTLGPITVNSTLGAESLLAAGSYAMQVAGGAEIEIGDNVNFFIGADFAHMGVAGLVGLNTSANEVVLQIYRPTSQVSPGFFEGDQFSYYYPNPGLSNPTGGQTIGVGPAPVQVVAADVNGDGNLDLLIAHNDATAGLGVLMGNGDGTFQSEVPYTIGGPVTNLAVADIDGDGFPDVVVVTPGSPGTITVLLNNGSGTFTAQNPGLTAGNGAAQIALSDVNGDGLPDIVVLNVADVNVGVLAGNGDGTFQPMATSATSAPTTTPVAFAITDWNRDGYPDIVVGGNSSATGYSDGTILFGAGVSGFNAFQDLRDLTCGGATLTAMAAADLNGDGVPDLIIGTNVSGFNFYINNANLANNGFGICGSEIFDSGTVANHESLATSSIAAADFNGSGAKNVILIPTGTNFGQAAFGTTYTGGTLPLAIAAPTGTHNVASSFTPVSGSTYGPSTFFAIPLTISSLPIVNLNPASVTFTNVAAGTTASQTVTVTNVGTANLVFGASPVSYFGLQGDFGFTTTCGGATLAPNTGHCTITVTFAPSLAESQSTELALADNAAGGAQGIVVSGTATGIPQASFSATSFSFGDVPVNYFGTCCTQGLQSLTVTNTGTDNLVISSLTTTLGLLGVPSAFNNFGAYNCVGTVITPGNSCTVSLYFEPVLVGMQTATVAVAYNAAGSPQTIGLSGNGTGTPASITLSYFPNPTTNTPVTTGPIDFGTHPVFMQSNAVIVTMTNSGQGGLVLPTSPFVTFSDPSFISPMNQANCFSSGPLLEGNSSCSFPVYFLPQSASAVSATLSIMGVPQTIPLMGNGSANASLGVSPISLAFGNQALNTTSAYQTVTVTNNGTATANLFGITFSNNVYAQAGVSGTCGITLAPQTSCLYGVWFTPTANGAVPATMYIGGVLQTVALSGTGGSGVAVIGISPNSLSFADQPVNSMSSGQPVTITNTGGAPFTFGTPFTSFSNPAYSATATTCAATLAGGGAFCTVTVAFDPSAEGSAPGTLTIGGVTQTVSLMGTGLAPVLVVTPTMLAFGNQPVNMASAGQTVTITNNGNTAFTFGTPFTSFSNPVYAATGTTCGTTLAGSGASCTISVSFDPTASGAVPPATLTIGGIAQTVSLTGTGTAPIIGVSPTTIAFGNQLANTVSASQPVTISNTGNGSFTFALPLAQIQETSPAGVSQQFGETATCTAALAPNTSCTINVDFAPTVVGAASATLTIGGLSQTISLTGTGTGAFLAVSANMADAGSQGIGTTTNVTTITVSNTGTAAANLSTGQSLQGPGAASWHTVYLCATVNPAASCQIIVFFEPVAAGPQPATLTLTDNATNSPQTISLTGVGVTPGLSIDQSALSFGSIDVGAVSAAQTITITNTGTAGLYIVSPSVGGSNPSAFGIVNNCFNGSVQSGGIPPNQTCTIVVTFDPNAVGALTETLNIPDYVPGAPQQISLSGTGAAPVDVLSPAAGFNFGNVSVNTTSAGQTATVTNTGTQTLSVSGASVGGANPAYFTATNNCTTVAAGGGCTIVVAFAPAGFAPSGLPLNLSATLEVTTQEGSGSPQIQTINLKGIVVAGPVDDSASTAVTSSAWVRNRTTGLYTGTVTVKNTGSLGLSTPLYLVMTSLPAGVAPTNATGTVTAGPYYSLPAVLAPGQTQSMAVSFSDPGNTTISFTPKVYSGPVQ